MRPFLLSLFLISAASAARAQCPDALVVGEQWTSYCDAGQSRARYSLRMLANPADLPTLPATIVAEVGAIDDTAPGLIVLTPFDEIVTHGAGDFEFIESWSLAEFPTLSARRIVQVSWECNGFPFPWISLEETDGPFAVPPVTCEPNAVTASTWGAVKALYR